ncbi:MAG: hypothetical protein IJD70_01630 [Clostridia bacterium]|nr:hypothetical protein [Clostridia bacterium]
MNSDIFIEGREKIRGVGGKLWFKILFALLASLPMIAALYLALYYIYGPGEGYFHSDCTDTLYWANAALEGNGIFDDQYNYAALLPFSTVWIMQPLIKIFGFGITAHNLGMAIFAILFAGSIYFCAKSAGCSHLWSSTSVFAVFMVLSCSDKLREMMWGHTIYYSLGIVLLFYLLGLGMRLGNSIEKGNRVGVVIFGVLLLGLSIGSATNGMQVLVLTLLPAIAAFVAERVFAGNEGIISKKSFPAFVSAAVMVAGTIIGLEVLVKITNDGAISAGYAAGYSGWSDVSIWLTNAQKFVNHYFSLLGVNMKQNAPLFDGESIKYFFRIIVGIVLLVMPIVILCLYGKLKSRGVKIMVWAHFVLTAVVLFGYVCGELSAANWRLTPIIGSSIMLCVCGLRDLVSDFGLFKVEEKAEVPEATEEDAELYDEGSTMSAVREAKISGKKTAQVVLSRVCSLVLAVLILSSYVFAKEIDAIPADYGRDNTNHRLAEFLVSEGLEYGYATFWYAQAITALSNSEVRVRNMDTNERDGVIGRHYQSSLNWYNDQEGVEEYFVILSSSEYQKVSSTKSWQSWMDEYYLRHYEDPNDAKGFRIYVFSENVLSYFGSDARAG